MVFRARRIGVPVDVRRAPRGRKRLRGPRRDRLPCEGRVDAHGEQVRSRAQFSAHVDFKGQLPKVLFAGLFAVEENLRVVNRGAEAQQMPVADGRRLERAKIPDDAEIIAQRGIGRHFVERTRDRHRDGPLRHAGRPIFSEPDIVRVLTELPDAIEFDGEALGVGLGIEHGMIRFGERAQTTTFTWCREWGTGGGSMLPSILLPSSQISRQPRPPRPAELSMTMS